MFNFWEQFILNAVVGVLHGFKIDPTKVPAFKETLVVILNAVCELLGVQPPLVQ